MELWWLYIKLLQFLVDSSHTHMYSRIADHELQCNDLTKIFEAYGTRELLKAKCEFMSEQIIVDRRHLGLVVLYSFMIRARSGCVIHRQIKLRFVRLCALTFSLLLVLRFVSGNGMPMSQFSIIEPNRHHIFSCVLSVATIFLLFAILCELCTLSAYNN